MPLITTDLDLGAIVLADADGGPARFGSVVVGDPPQWSDGSMSTYATTYEQGSHGNDYAFAPFSALVATVDVVRSIDVTATIAGGGQAGTARAGIGRYPRDGLEEEAAFDIPADTVPRVYTASLGLEYGAPLLVTGGAALFSFGVAGNVSTLYAATCYELALTVTYWGGQPPRRIFPRDDGLTGGAPRNYPPSKGVQLGNRAAGGYV